MDDLFSLIDNRIEKSGILKAYLKSIPCRVISFNNDGSVLVESVIDGAQYNLFNYSGSSLNIGENVQVYYKDNISNGYIGASITKEDSSPLMLVDGDAYVGELFSDNYRVIGDCSFKCLGFANCMISFNYVLIGSDIGNVTFKFVVDDVDLSFTPIISVVNGSYYSGSFTIPCSALSGEHILEIKGKGSAAMSSIQLTVCGHGVESCEKPYDPTTQEDYLYSIANNEVSIIRYLGNNLRPAIPDTIESLPVRRLYTTAFNYSNVEAVYIPDGVIEIQ